jgi:molybdate transport system regulatory protein
MQDIAEGHNICAPRQVSRFGTAHVSSGRQTGAGIVSGTRLTLRVDFGPGRSIGPGKIRLLEAIERTGSISQAGRTLGMSYRRAWLLIDDMNQCFRDAVVSARPGGAQGGGAVLTEFGAELVRDYRAIETAAEVAAQKRLRGLEAALRKSNAAKPSAAKSAAPKKTSTRRRKP